MNRLGDALDRRRLRGTDGTPKLESKGLNGDTRRTTIERPTMFSVTPSHITGTWVGAVGASLARTSRPRRDGGDAGCFS